MANRGKIKTLVESKGFGFIRQDGGGQDIFFHANAVKGEVDFDSLSVGMKVEYESETTPKGLNATYVKALEAAKAPKEPENVYRFLNPYNFVGFPTIVEKTNGEAAQPQTALAAALQCKGLEGSGQREIDENAARLLGKCAPPPHDRYVGISGEIACTLKTVSPLFISDAHGVRRRPSGHTSHEFFKLDGKPALPATSLRGMIRSVFETVTNSCMATISDVYLSKHLPPREALQLIPARVERDNDGNLSVRLMKGAKYQGQKTQIAAWLPMYFSNPIRKSRSFNWNLNTAQRKDISPDRVAHGMKCWALLKIFHHPDPKFLFWSVQDIAENGSDLQKTSDDELIVEGYCCITGQNIENKHDERFFFSLDNGQNESRIRINKDVRKAYENLIDDYQKRHADNVRKLQNIGVIPTEPQKGNSGFSRFIVEKSDAKLKDGDLVYAMLKDSENTQSGLAEVDFIVPVSIPRVIYEHAVPELLPDNLQPCGSDENEDEPINNLCPACRVFGWTHEEKQKQADAAAKKNDDKQKKIAYAGRVRFSNGTLEKSDGTLPETPLAILSSPKPTTTLFYLRPKHENGIPVRWRSFSANKGYDRQHNALRGRKFYRHHKQVTESSYRRLEGRCDDQNRTIRDALAPGAEFSFTVRFENLASVELGALLWALEMDRKSYHRLGHAKPLGFGSVTIAVDSLNILDPQRRYASLHEDVWQEAQNWHAECVEKFKKALWQKFNKDDFEVLEQIQDLRALLSERADNLPIHYPRTARIPDADGKNFEWFIGNKRKENLTLPEPTKDKGLPLLRRDGSID